MRGDRYIRAMFSVGVTAVLLSATTAWGYFFDERREMSLSGFAYSRSTWALSNDDIGTFKGLWQRGNQVQWRNFLTLEWRHNLNRASREFPTVGPAFRFLNFDAFDYYLNMRFEYDAMWMISGKGALLRQGGRDHQAKYFGNQREAYPGQFARYSEFEYESSRRRIKEGLWNLQLFEWYFNITKGPLFIRLGRQNLSWGESDGFRLLDQINPLNNSFGGFLTALDERRVPLDMLRAQWSFGTVGPVQDLTLEGFVSVDNESAANYGILQGSFWTAATNTAPIMVKRTPCGDPFFRSRDFPAKGQGVPCSVRSTNPHASLSDARGGGRILGTIRDFTFSIAHYYTWADLGYVRTTLISPTPEHLLWDLNGMGNPALLPATNPWGANDPTVGLNNVVGGPGGFLANSPSAVERNLRSSLNNKRIQVTGASLSFPVNALTGMFVGSDSPLYYLYTTFRSEIAFFQNVGVNKGYHDLDAATGSARFLTPTTLQSGVPITGLVSTFGFRPEFAPGGRFASEANCQREDGLGIRGCRAGGMKTRDSYAWLVGLDHNQWIRFLNPTNSFTISAQLFWFRGLGVNKRYKQGVPPGLSNDIDNLPVRPRSAAPTGPNPTPQQAARPGGVGNRAPACIPGPDGNTPCAYKALLGFPVETQIFTLAISTPYLSGNLTPRVTFFYDFSGSWLVQPGIDWTFWDPFRMQIRYNYLDGRYAGIGFFKTRDNIWLELQYLLY
jgi:hypothetical protein